MQIRFKPISMFCLPCVFLLLCGCASSTSVVSSVEPGKTISAQVNRPDVALLHNVHDVAERMADDYVHRINTYLDDERNTYLFPAGETFNVFIQNIEGLQDDRSSYVALQFLALFRSKLINRLHRSDAHRVGKVMINEAGVKGIRDYEAFIENNRDMFNAGGQEMTAGANSVLVLSTKIDSSAEIFLSYQLIMNQEPLYSFEAHLNPDWPEVKSWIREYQRSLTDSRWHEQRKQLLVDLSEAERLALTDPDRVLAAAGGIWSQIRDMAAVGDYSGGSASEIEEIKDRVRHLVVSTLTSIRFSHGLFGQVLFSATAGESIPVWAHLNDRSVPVPALKLKMRQQGQVAKAVTDRVGKAEFSVSGFTNAEVSVSVDLTAYGLPHAWSDGSAHIFPVENCSGDLHGMVAYAVQKLLRSSEWNPEHYSPIFVDSVQTGKGVTTSGSNLGREIRSVILDALRDVPGLKVESERFRGTRSLNVRAKLFSHYQINPPQRSGSIFLELRPDNNPKQVLFARGTFPFTAAAYPPPPVLPPRPSFTMSSIPKLQVDVKHEQGKRGDFEKGDTFRYYITVERSLSYLALFYRSGNNWAQLTDSFRPSNGITIWPWPGSGPWGNGIPVDGENDNDEIWVFACDRQLPALVLGSKRYQGDGFSAIVDAVRGRCGRFGYDSAQLTILSKAK